MTLSHLLDSAVTTTQSRNELVRRIEKLTKINNALMQRVERSMEQQGNAYSLFQTAIGLEAQVRARTDELKSTLCRLERTNGELTNARDAAELANRLKTRFFTAVGHDLLQPLHAARLTLSAMERADGAPENGRLAIQIDHALSTIEELLKTVFDLSKLEAGIVKPALQAVPLGELIQALVLEFEPLAHQKGLRLSGRCENIDVTSDPLMLRRMIQNLLVNAVHYTDQGKVKILARRRRDTMVRIEIWDTGPGIPPGERKRIFEEFQRGSASEKSRRGGMGLGLSIVQRTAAALQHSVDLCSHVGKGTRFGISVPYAGPSLPKEPISSVAAMRQAYGFAGVKVAVIENDATVLEAMRTLLEHWSCEMRCLHGLSDVDQLVMQAPAFRPDLILADYHLDRGECGLHAILRLREWWGQDIPAVIVTADYAPDIAERSRSMGCEVLCKPVKPAELRALMGHLMSGRG